MTVPQSSQGGIVSVVETTATPITASQFGIISVQQDPPLNTPSNASQFGAVIVIANGQRFIALNPVIGLGCWSPCATLAHRFGVVPTEGIQNVA